MKYDFLIVGAGLFGAVFAEQADEGSAGEILVEVDLGVIPDGVAGGGIRAGMRGDALKHGGLNVHEQLPFCKNNGPSIEHTGPFCQ